MVMKPSRVVSSSPDELTLEEKKSEIGTTEEISREPATPDTLARPEVDIQDQSQTVDDELKQAAVDLQFKQTDPETKKEDEKIHLEGSEQIKAGIESLPPKLRLQANVALVVPELAEDIVNSAIDVTNFVSSKFWDTKLLPNTDVINSIAPDSPAENTFREIAKFMTGYSAILKGVGAVSKFNKASQASVAGALTDFIATDPDASPLLEGLLKKTSIGADVVEFLNGDPADQTNLEKRLRNTVYGVIEGQVADKFIDAIKLMKKARDAKRIAEPPPTPKEAPTLPGGQEAPKTLSDVADIPVIDPDLPPPLPQDDFLQFDYTAGVADDAAYKAVASNRGLDVNKIRTEGAFLNLTKFHTTDDVRRIMSNTFKANPGQFSIKRYTREEIADIADSYGMTYDDLINLDVKESGRLGLVLAANQVELNAAESLHNIINKANAGEIPEEMARAALGSYISLVNKTSELNSFRGLLFHEGGIPVQVKNKSAQAAYNVFKEVGSLVGNDYVQIANAIKNGAVPKEMAKAATKGKFSGFYNALMAIRINGLLSGPATHARNIVGNFINIGTEVGENLTAATLNTIFNKGSKEGITFSDAYHSAAGAFDGFLDALAIVTKKKEGKLLTPGFDKSDYMNIINEPNSWLGRAVNMLGNAPGKALRFEDDFMKHINARMKIRELAYRKGRTDNLTREQIENLIKNPDEHTLGVAYDFAATQTFTNDIKNETLQKIAEFSSTPLGKLIAPFAHTNMNVLTYRLERIPGLNFLLSNYREAINSPVAAIRQKAQAKHFFTSSLAASTVYFLHSNDLITGDAPQKSSKLATMQSLGRQANSIRVGDKWLEYRRETPLGGILGIYADIAALNDAGDGRDPEFIQDAGSIATIFIANAFNPEYLTDATSKLIEAMRNEDHKAVDALLSFTGDQATSFAPYSSFMRQLNRAFFQDKQPVTFEAGKTWETVFNKLKAVYDPRSYEIAKRNILGEHVPAKEGLGPDFISPIGMTTEVKDPVLVELARLGGIKDVFELPSVRPFSAENAKDNERITSASYLNLAMPPKTITVNRKDGTSEMLRLNIVQYDELVQYTSGIHPSLPKRYKPLRQELEELIANKRYQKASHFRQVKAVSRVISGYKEAGSKIFQAQGNDGAIRSMVIELKLNLQDIENDL